MSDETTREARAAIVGLLDRGPMERRDLYDEARDRTGVGEASFRAATNALEDAGEIRRYRDGGAYMVGLTAHSQ